MDEADKNPTPEQKPADFDEKVKWQMAMNIASMGKKFASKVYEQVNVKENVSRFFDFWLKKPEEAKEEAKVDI